MSKERELLREFIACFRTTEDVDIDKAFALRDEAVRMLAEPEPATTSPDALAAIGRIVNWARSGVGRLGGQQAIYQIGQDVATLRTAGLYK